MTTEQLKTKADDWHVCFNIAAFFTVFFLILSWFYPMANIAFGFGSLLIVFCGVKMNGWNERYLNSF